MKVVLMAQNMIFGGIQRLVVDEANEFAERGHDVWVVYFEQKHNSPMIQSLRIPAENIVHIPYSRMRSVSGLLATVRFLRKVRPDILCTQYWFENTVGRIAALFARVPTVLTFEQSVYDNVKTRKQFFLDKVLQGVSKKIIVPSDAGRLSLVRHGIKPENILILDNGLDVSRFRDTNRLFDRGSVGFKSSDFVVVFVARLVQGKGADVLLRAATRLHDARFLIVGDGQEREGLEHFAHEHDLESRVVFLGARRDIPEILHAADCFVLPSRREGMPLAVIEALAAGLPVIVSRFDGVESVIQDGENGLVVPIDDDEALAEAIEKIRLDPALRAALKKQASESADKYSIEHHVEALLKLADE